MKVISTNLGKATTIHWNNKEEQSGIFKHPVVEPIFLRSTLVDKDTVADLKHHGGTFKACYLFSSTHYPYWQEHYPSLKWEWGMFGENITVKGMDEAQLLVGSVYQLGNALVQITIPRQPCYKLGIRFEDQKIIKEFIEHGHPGTYVRILKEGSVKKGDDFVLQEEAKSSLSIAQLYKLLYSQEKDRNIVDKALAIPSLPERTREKLNSYIKKGP